MTPPQYSEPTLLHSFIQIRTMGVAGQLLLILALVASVSGRQGYLRYQRGDQGPDEETSLSSSSSSSSSSGGSTSASSSSSFSTSSSSTTVAVSPGGPNVCRSRSRSYCCPGWKVRHETRQAHSRNPGRNLILNIILDCSFRKQTLRVYMY